MSTGSEDDILEVAAAWSGAGRRIAIATVVATWGSSPRPPGSQLVVDDAGRFVGSVSGGCVEAAVVDAAREVIDAGAPRLLEFGVTDTQAWSVGLACGGRIEVHVEPLPELLDAIREAQLAKRPVVLVTALASGQQRLVGPLDADRTGDPAHADAVRLAAIGRSEAVELEGERCFLQVYNPPQRLIVVGAVHIAQHLCPMGSRAGFEVVLVDPRTAWATDERFPGVTLLRQWPEAAFDALAPDTRTAVVTLTHDPKLDDPALLAALASPAFYIGALGSRRTHAARLGRLRAAGVGSTDLERIHAPVGLAIGARAAGELAVSILAELIRVARRGVV